MKNFINFSGKLLLLFLVSALFACEPATSSQGIVKNANGELLENVTVVLEVSTSDSNSGFEKKSEQKTKADGAFNFVAITPNAKQSRLVFQKEGYQTLVKELIPKKLNNVEAVLESK